MDESVSEKATPQYSSWVLWLIWVAATCAGAFAMAPLRSVIGPLLPSVFIAWVFSWLGTQVLSGLAQHLAMPLFFPDERRWFERTLFGAFVGIIVGFLLGVAILGVEFLTLSYNFTVVAAGIMFGGSVPIAVEQWRLLRRYSRRAGWWCVIGPVAWTAGMLAAFRLWHPGPEFAEAFLGSLLQKDIAGIGRGIATDLTMCVIAGAITGATLLYILRARPPAAVRAV